MNPTIHPANILGSPASSAAGGALIVDAVTRAAQAGLPTNALDWINFLATIVLGVGAALMKG